MTDQHDALLPCPFCGHDTPEFERLGTPRQSCIVACGNCGARHESSDEGTRCGSSWNARAATQPTKPEQQAGGVPAGLAAWENSEGWESLAWELCADENGEESCNELIWEGGPVPEPWGERWLRYEDEAKRLIKLVHKHAAAPSQSAVHPLSEAQPNIKWPKSRDVGRSGDMTPAGQSVLRVGLDSDNDVYVNMWDSGRCVEEFQNVSIEFCNGGGGGGKSPRTRAALINLMTAIEEDNANDPSKGWRLDIVTKEGS